MADPYAVREAGPVGERPAGDSALLAVLERRGGFVARSVAELAAAPPPGTAFAAALVRDESLLPPLARVDAPFAVALLLRAGEPAAAAAAALEALDRFEGPVLAVKEGLVGGPAGSAGAEVVGADLIEAAVVATLAGTIEWERDPDFGYEVAARVPGIDGTPADALCPRLLYAAADRVYEHAEGVVAVKRERHRRAGSVAELDPRILAATGWPIAPTGEEWKD